MTISLFLALTLMGHQPGDRLVVMDAQGGRIVSCMDVPTIRLLRAAKDPEAAVERAKDKVIIFEPYSSSQTVVQGIEFLEAIPPDLAKVRILTGPDRGKTVYLSSRFLLTPIESARVIGEIEAKEKKENLARITEIKGEIEAAKKAARVKSSSSDLSVRKRVYDREIGKLTDAIAKKWGLSKETLVYLDKRSVAQVQKEMEELPADEANSPETAPYGVGNSVPRFPGSRRGSSGLCGAVTKTTGAPCRNPVVGGGYCHLHR